MKLMTSRSGGPTPAGRPKAFPLIMWGAPRSPEAQTLVEHLLQSIILPARTGGDKHGVVTEPRPSSIVALRKATGALLADLFDFYRGASQHSRPRQGYHGMSRSDFSKKDLGFSYDIFRSAAEPLVASGLLAKTNGQAAWHFEAGNFKIVGGSKTCFCLTEAMIELGAHHGIPIDTWGTHWTRFVEGRPHPISDAPRLVLRKERRRDGRLKAPSVDHPFDPADPVPLGILERVERLNGYLSSQRISGLAFAGLRRIFNNGDVLPYGWDKGGRYYSLPVGHRYEAWNSQRRYESVTLNGEAVTEVDLRASHLTLLHGLLGVPFDANEDPYDIDGWPRAVIKAWVSQAIGASNPGPKQWSEDAEDDYENERPGRWMGDEFPIREVRAAVTNRHPVLVDLGVCGVDALDLQFHEAEILTAAMETLMFEHDVPALPVHDALIVPVSAADLAQRTLQAAFVSYVEGVIGHPSSAIPRVTIKGA